MAAEPSYPGSQSGIIHCCPAQDSWRLQQQKLGQHTGPFHHWQIRTRLNYHCSQFAGTRSPSPANSDVNIFRPAVNQSVAAAPLHLQGGSGQANLQRPRHTLTTSQVPDCQHQSSLHLQEQTNLFRPAVSLDCLAPAAVAAVKVNPHCDPATQVRFRLHELGSNPRCLQS